MDKVLVKSKYNKKYHTHFFSFYTFRKTASIYLYFIAGALIIFLAVMNSLNSEANATQKAMSWAIAVLFLTSIPFFTTGRIKSVVRRNEKERGDKEEVMEFTRAKIVIIPASSEGKVTLGWEFFTSVYEFEEYFFMYIDRERGLVVPKNDIIEGDVETLRKLISNNLRPGKKGKSNFKKMYKD